MTEQETDMQEHSTARTRLEPSPALPPLYRRVIANETGFGGLVASMRSVVATRRGEAAALKLDTRILKGNPFKSTEPQHVSYSDPVAYSGRPINYPVYEKAHHFRVKVQEFSSGGYELVISSINIQRHSDLAALHLRRGPRLERKGDQESIEKARRTARKSVRLKCKEMGADHLVTFTTRATISRDDLKAAWGRFTDNVSYHLKRKFDYVCVCEPHPTNPEHLHLHAAIRGRLAPREMVIFRRCWYIALGGSGKEKGAAAPGGFNIRHIRVKGGALRTMDKIASYISKYITKDSYSVFNKKRYWASRIKLMDVRAYWLESDKLDDAWREVRKMFEISLFELPKTDFFRARNLDLIWMRFIPPEMSGCFPPF